MTAAPPAAAAPTPSAAAAPDPRAADRRLPPGLVPGVAVALVALLAVSDLWRLCRAFPSLPLWDEAAHGFAGVEVADAIRHWNPIDLFLAINRQALWPFVHSLLLAPMFLIGGRSVAAAEATSLVLAAGTVVLLFVAGHTLHPTRGTWVGLLAAALALLSPEFRTFATLAMLEIPGAFLLLLAFVLHAHAANEPLAPRRLAWAGVATTALFLCKYNYGLLWLAPLAIWEWRRLPADFRARAAAAVHARMTRAWWLRPMPMIFAAGAVAIAAILATGGGEFTLLGARVSMRSPGNLAYVLWLAFLAWMLVPRRGRPSRATWLAARLPQRARILAGTIAIPLAVWFTLPYPNRVKEFFGFVANRDSGAPLPARLVFYARTWAADYSPAAWVGIATLLLTGSYLFLVAVRIRAAGRRSPGDLHPQSLAAAQLASLGFLVAFVATTAHRYVDSRFFFTVAPLLWLCAAGAMIEIADFALGRLAWAPLREGLWAAAGAVLLFAAWVYAPPDAVVLAHRAAFRGPISLAPALDAILDGLAPRLEAPAYLPAALEPAPAPDPDRDFPARAILLGYGNVLSPGLVAWRAREARPEIPRAALPRRAPYVAPGAEDVVLDTRARWVDERADLVIVALADSLPAPHSADYANEVWADRETAARVAASEAWALDHTAMAAPWVIRVYRRAR